jgi:hypothetical protein
MRWWPGRQSPTYNTYPYMPTYTVGKLTVVRGGGSLALRICKRESTCKCLDDAVASNGSRWEFSKASCKLLAPIQ